MNTGNRSDGVLNSHRQPTGKVESLPTTTIDEEVQPGY